MRVCLLAGMAALSAAAENYDDDDLTFLRMLQGNGSNGTTLAPTTLTPTTVVSGNATTVPATTVVSGNATTVVAVTTVASGGGGATTVAGTTAAPVDTLCAASTYTSLGFNDPGTLTQTTKGIMVDCPDTQGDSPALDYSTDEKSFYEWGDRAFTTANLAKCTSAQKTERKCAATPDKATKDFFNSGNIQGKAAMLERCCTVMPTPTPSIPAPPGTIVDGASLVMSYYKASTCAEADYATPAEIRSHEGKAGTLMTANPLTIPAGCYDMGYMMGGLYFKLKACNSTAATGANRAMAMEMFFASDCTGVPVMAQVSELSNCLMDTRRRLASHSNSTGSTMYRSDKCTGGQAVTELEILATLSIAFTNLGTLTVVQKDTMLSTTCNTVKTIAVAAAGGATGVTITIERCVGTGALATATFTASRRSRRRLASHAATVDTTLKTVVPAASATTIQAGLALAAASGTLSPGTLGTTIITALQADTTIASAVSNVTASVTTIISQPTLVSNVQQTSTTTSTSSTSGAFGQALSAFVGFLVMGSLLI